MRISVTLMGNFDVINGKFSMTIMGNFEAINEKVRGHQWEISRTLMGKF